MFKDEGISTVLLPISAINWQADLFPFSRAICAGKFDKAAPRVATFQEAVLDLSAKVMARLP
jgi:hypothetical protein